MGNHTKSPISHGCGCQWSSAGFLFFLFSHVSLEEAYTVSTVTSWIRLCLRLIGGTIDINGPTQYLAS